MVETIETAARVHTAQEQRDIERKAFSLYMDLDSFMDAMDSQRNVDAVLPTSSQKEVADLDRYFKGEMG